MFNSNLSIDILHKILLASTLKHFFLKMFRAHHQQEKVNKFPQTPLLGCQMYPSPMLSKISSFINKEKSGITADCE